MDAEHQNVEEFKVFSMVSEVYSRDIVFPNKYQVDTLSNDGSIAKISVFPLQQGFGTTIGNIFRRTLLSSIRGVAVDNLKISDAIHEYRTIVGVQQNVCEIVYNLRRVVFKTDLEHCNVKFSVKGPKKVYASDIVVGDKVQVVNPKQFLFEIVSDRIIDVEFDITSGIGDVFVSRDEDRQIGTVLLDKHFSPVLNVGVEVRQTMVNNRTDYDKLVLDIKTNGSITAEEAFKIAVSILSNFLCAIDNAQNNMLKVDKNDEQGNIEKIDFNYNLMRRVKDLELSVRSLNCLCNEGITFIGDLVCRNELDMLKTPNFGRKSLNELKEILGNMGLSFGMNIEWPLPNMAEMEAKAKGYFENN